MKRGSMHQRLFKVVLFVIAIALSAAASARAQGEGAIHGTVTAREDRSPLPGAILELQSVALPAPLKATTATDGHFAFLRLVPGDYVLTITHASFREERH